MPSPFTIKPAADTVAITLDKSIDVVFSVSNSAGRPITARGRISNPDPKQRAWFQLADHPERKLSIGETTEFKVSVTVPATAQSGSYRLQFDVVEVDNEESFTEGSPVGFEVKATSTVVRPGFKWWPIAVAAAVLVLAVGGFVAWKLAEEHPRRQGPEAARPVPRPGSSGARPSAGGR